MNWIHATELFNRLNRTWDRTVCLSRPHYMFVLDVRPKDEYNEGHLPTARRIAKDKEGSWHVTGGFEDIANKETIVLYDMTTSHVSQAGLQGPISEAASFIWRLLKGSRNQSRIYLLNGGFERFTEFYPNCKSYEATYTIGELGKLRVLPLHIPLIAADLPGKLFLCPPEGLAADRVAHVICDIDAHVNCTRYRDPTFGFAPDENAYVRQCTIDNKQEVNEEVVMTNLEEFYNVSLFIYGHLKDERNVMVYGERGDTVATAVLVAFLIKYEFLEVENAVQVLGRVHPLTTIDETSRACLEVFRDKLHSDPDFQTEEQFAEHVKPEDLPPEQPGKPIEPDNKLSLVASIVKELIPEFDKKKIEEERERSSGFTDAADKIVLNIINEGRREVADRPVTPPTVPVLREHRSSGFTTAAGQLLVGIIEEGQEVVEAEDRRTRKPGIPVKPVWSATKELAVSREDVRRFEEETLWKMLHHDRVCPPVFGNIAAFLKTGWINKNETKKKASVESQPEESC